MARHCLQFSSTQKCERKHFQWDHQHSSPLNNINRIMCFRALQILLNLAEVLDLNFFISTLKETDTRVLFKFAV